MKLKIVHHEDADGFFGAYVIHNHEKDTYDEIEFITYNYGWELPTFEKTDHVILVDISFPMDYMVDVNELVESFVWIDHHISAINDYKKLPIDKQIIDNQLDTRYAGCEKGF